MQCPGMPVYCAYSCPSDECVCGIFD